MLIEKVKESLAGLFPESETAAPEESVPPVAEEGENVEAAAEEQGEEAAPQFGIQECDYNEKGIHLDVSVEPGQVVDAAELLDQLGFTLEAVTGVDWLSDGQMEVVYDYSHYKELCRVAVRARLERQNPEVPTISDIYPGANWHERETHDFFGIVFAGHPDLTPLLLPEDADFHPLLKDFQA
jgi:NADH-quinone oxidoreductase subunit C